MDSERHTDIVATQTRRLPKIMKMQKYFANSEN